MKIRLFYFVLLIILTACKPQTESNNNFEKEASDVKKIAANKEVKEEAISLGLAYQKMLPDGVLSTILEDTSKTQEEKNRILDKIAKKYLMGKINPSEDERFAEIPVLYGSKTKKQYMRKEALSSFLEMAKVAEKDGIVFRIVSATRPFDIQKSIWEAKWKGDRQVDGVLLPKTVKNPKDRALRILRWSSMPATSRHHWGTDIDINSVNPAYFEQPKGKKEYEWLCRHAANYGFCQVYSLLGENRPTGYQEEKWHWSYLPLSIKFTESYKESIKDEDITGFLGSETAKDIFIVKNYVLGINPDCI